MLGGHSCLSGAVLIQPSEGVEWKRGNYMTHFPTIAETIKMTDTITDAIGTIRRQDYDDGNYAIWVLIAEAVWRGNIGVGGYWTTKPMLLCVYSSVPAICGSKANPQWWEFDQMQLLAPIPGSPAYWNSTQSFNGTASLIQHDGIERK